MKNTMKKPVAIPVEKLRPFDGHPFKVKDDDEMNTLIESIQVHGILSPLIVRPIENTDGYEVISGHRRLHAAQKAGITEVPALIYALDRDAAAIAVVDSNLHREHILPSEKAFAYRMKLEAMSRQGHRSDLTSDQLGRKLGRNDALGDSLLPASFCTQTPFQRAEYAPDASCCLLPQWRRHPGQEHKLRQGPR